MLDRLPNEILVKILSKTETATAKNCRFLSNRYNGIVERFELQKEELIGLSIGKEYPPSNLYEIFMGEKLYVTRQFETMDALLVRLQNIVNNIRTVTSLSLTKISITNELLDILLNANCMRKIRSLHIYDCEFAPETDRKWLVYSGCLRLHRLDIAETPMAVLSEILTSDLVWLRIYQSSLVDNATDLSWLDDNLLHKWYSQGKHLFIRNCITRLTIGGILTFLKDNVDNFDKWQNLMFGILRVHRVEDIVEALDAAQAIYYAEDYLPTNSKIYRVSRISGKKVLANFGCRVTEVPVENE